MPTSPDGWQWRPTASGFFLHIDSGYGYAVCGVGRLVEPIEGRDYAPCCRCKAWDGRDDG
jgi:hypothetical protein